MVGSFVDCCAPLAIGDATAQPRRVMNSRRLMQNIGTFSTSLKCRRHHSRRQRYAPAPRTPGARQFVTRPELGHSCAVNHEHAPGRCEETFGILTWPEMPLPVCRGTEGPSWAQTTGNVDLRDTAWFATVD